MFNVLPFRRLFSPKILVALMLVVTLISLTSAVVLADLTGLLAVIQSADSGDTEAAKLSAAWREIIDSPDAKRVFTLLAAMDQSRPIASNWIATAIDAVVEKLRAHDAMPTANALERFVVDRSGDPQARQLAYEMLVDADATAPKRLLPDMLDDPSLPLRRDAVEQLATLARMIKDKSPDEAKAMLEKAFAAARDFDQVNRLAADLKSLGVEVDLTRHFGIIRRWKLIAPFDDTDRKGFATAYPPEVEAEAGAIDYSATHQGKNGPVRWFEHTTDPKENLGRVDLNKIQGRSNNVSGYAATEFISPIAGPAQLRLQSFNALKIWLNGKQVAGFDVYHGGSQFDQYVIPVELVKGKNVILVKLCQNDQPQGWAQQWHFSLRVCDEIGAAILSTDRPE